MRTVLAVDDELSVRQAYRFVLSRDYDVLLAENGEEALSMLDRTHVDIILLDMVMPGMTGLQLLAEVRRREVAAPVIVVTASNTSGLPEEALKRGACEFLAKPFDIRHLSLIVERTLREAQTRRELLLLRQTALRGADVLLGDSSAMRELHSNARAAMESESPVLIIGENGTGKRSLARAIHAGSSRAEAPLVSVPSSGIAAALVEGDLFGRATGAADNSDGLLRAAERGSVLIDEVGDLPMPAQARLAQFLREGCYSPVGSEKRIAAGTRILASTRQDLFEQVRQGAFNDDLLALLGAVKIAVPPLRRRREDIPSLVSHFLAKHGPRAGARIRSFSPGAFAALTRYPWPGNLRELESVVERLVLLHGSKDVIEPAQLAEVLPTPSMRPELEAVAQEY